MDKKLAVLGLPEFNALLASKAAVPGGGGAAALVGAVGIALGSMVGNLTTGKPKYANVEEDIVRILAEAETLRAELLELIDRDAEGFEPLSRAYSMPRETEEQREEKARVMEECLRTACAVPVDIMRAVCRAIDMHAELAEKGSALAISDVGVGVLCCSAALESAVLNVYINTKSMADKDYAISLERECDEMLEKYVPLAKEIHKAVLARLR